MTETNTLATTISNTITSMLEQIHTCLPGSIESYDYKTAKATVKPLIQKSFIDGSTLVLPILKDVPVIFPRSSTSGVTFPLNKGDGVLIVFSERALDKWYDSGKDQTPGDNRKFDLSDSICIPGLFSFNNPNIASNNDDLEVQHKDQKITITKGGDIQLGKSSLKKLVNESFLTVFDNHTHLIGAIPAFATIPTLIPTVPSTPANLTSKVEAE